MAFLAFIGLFFLQPEIPYKEKEAFELSLAYSFKSPTAAGADQPNWSASERAIKTTSPLPYLKVNLRIMDLEKEEQRIRISHNHGNMVVNRKVSEGDEFVIDMGYTDDMKDRTKPNEYVVEFLTSDRKRTVSQIVIQVDENGRFFVNGEQRGKL